MSDETAVALASLDGELMPASQATIPATDEGLLRGDGIFEVIRLYGGRPFGLEAHFERLIRSAANLRLEIDLDRIRIDVHRLLDQVADRPAGHDLLRIVVTRGGRRLLLTEPLAPHPDRITLGSVTFSPTRVLDGIKSLSYASNMLASRLARERGFDEALLVTPHGRVLEAPTSSIFWVKGGDVLTPPLSEHILASITRAVVVEVAAAQERPCSLDDLYGADAAFLASTTREVHPIAAVDGNALPGDDGLTARIAAKVSEHIRAHLPGS